MKGDKVIKQKVETPLSEKLLEMTETLSAQNGVDPQVLEITTPNAIIDGMIVVGATSRRHAQGMADAIRRLCREKGWEILRTEGYETGEWILVDCNDIVINILINEARQLYRLEDLWSVAQRSSLEEIIK